MTPIRILQIVSTVNNTSGIFKVIDNWHKYIDTSKVQFDYLYFSENPQTCQKQRLIDRGSYCFYLPWKNPCQLVKELKKIFSKNKYLAIHSHVLQLPVIIFPLAKIYGIKYIIQHAHNPVFGENTRKAFRNGLLIHSVWPLISHRLACSLSTGTAFFRKNFTVINNGIEEKDFAYNPIIRTVKRQKLGLENNFVVGHIGHFGPQKNHSFLINIFEQIIRQNATSKLVLVGNGPLEGKIKMLAKQKKLQDKIIFLGARKDVAELYQAFDCFVFPSLFEGLGIVAVEAQAAGLPCILADTLPQEAFVCNYKKLPLGSAEKWAQEILNFTRDFKRVDTSAQIRAAGFSAKEVAKQMQNFYLELGKE